MPHPRRRQCGSFWNTSTIRNWRNCGPNGRCRRALFSLRACRLPDWLKHPDRKQEPGGRIGFAVSAVLSDPLAEALRKIKGADWKTFGKEEDGTLRQWSEVDFVLGEAYERKESRPLRYVGLRLLKPQGVLFGDGTDRHFHAVVTNQKIDGGRRYGKYLSCRRRPPPPRPWMAEVVNRRVPNAIEAAAL